MSTKRIMDTNGTARSYKRWPEALKREIVAASLAPGASVSVVARQYDVNANQVFSWRKRFPMVREPATAAPGLVPVLADDMPVLLDDDAIGLGVHIDGTADSRSGDQVLAVVNAHEAGLPPRRRRARGRLDEVMAHQLLEAPVEGAILADE